MQMRNALADAVIDGHKRTFGVQAKFHRLSNHLRIREDRLQQVGGQIGQSLDVLLGAHQAMSRK